MSRTTVRRGAAVALAVAGAFTLAACNSEGGATVTTPPATNTTTQAPTETQAPTQAPTETATETPSAPETSATETSAAGTGGNEAVTPDGTTLKYGQEGVFKEPRGTFKLKVKEMVAAPEAAYAAANVSKTNGNLYYINFDVTYLGGAAGSFYPTSINRYFLRPVFQRPETGKTGGSPSRDLPGCPRSSRDAMSVGQTVATCYFYQVTGPAPTKAMFDGLGDSKVIWSN